MKLALLSLGALFVVGCSAIPVQLHTETHLTHADGTVEHKSSDWHGTLDQLPEQLGKAGAELGDVTAQMAKELTDVPPPGKVELKDLSPALGKYQGKRGADFLSTAKDDKGEPISFEYVRLGQAEFDEFFKTSQEIHALVYQTAQVIRLCGETRAESTWIIPELVDGYVRLHELGWAHSVEVWEKDARGARALVGGIYGIAIGGAFAGESMFHLRTDASKIAFATLATKLKAAGFSLFDVQVQNAHLESLGCIEISRREYLARLAVAQTISAHLT